MPRSIAPMSSSTPRPLPVWSPQRPLVRMAAYAVVIAAAMLAYMRTVGTALQRADGLDAARALLAEGRLMESLQVALLVLGFLVALSPRPRPRRTLDLILALLLATAAVRELDDQLSRALFHRSHRVFMGALLAGVLALAYARRAELQRTVPAFLRRPAFYFLFFGGLLAVSLGKALGSSDVWHALVADDAAHRMAKRFVEEGLELAAYLVILLGVIEERLFRSES